MLSLVVRLALLAAACAPPAPPSPTAKATEAPKPATTVPAPAAKPTEAAKPATITLPPPEVKSVTIAHSTLEPTQLAYAMAKELGFFNKYGFEEVELVFSEGDAKTVQAVFSGAAQVAAGGVSVVISSLTTDTPLVTVSMTATRLTDSIVGGPDIKTPQDLKGKTLAISSFGSTAHGAALMGLKAMGLTTQDVTITQVGGQSSRIAALKSGSVAAAVVDVALDDEMKAQGFNILTRLPDTPLEYGRNGLEPRRDWFAKNPNATLALVAAALEGQNAIWTNTEKAIDVFQTWAQLKDRASAEKQVREFMKYGRRDMRWSREAWELTRETLAAANPAVANVDVTQAYTFEPLDKLKELGLNRALNIPETPSR